MGEKGVLNRPKGQMSNEAYTDATIWTGAFNSRNHYRFCCRLGVVPLLSIVGIEFKMVHSIAD